MDYDELPVNAIHVTGETVDTKVRTHRHVWSQMEEDALFRIWGRDNWRLTRHGKNTVFFAKWAEEMQQQHNIMVRPEEIQTKVNQTRSKYRQVKKVLAIDSSAPKWKKFDLVSSILANQYRPDDAEPVPLDSLENNRDISLSELNQMAAGVHSPTQQNSSGDDTMLAHEQMDTTTTTVNNHNMSGGVYIHTNDGAVSVGVENGFIGVANDIFTDPIVALNDDEIKNNFMRFQYQQQQVVSLQQHQISPDHKHSINGQLNTTEGMWKVEQQIDDNDTAMMTQSVIEMHQIQALHQDNENQPEQSENQLPQHKQEQPSEIYKENQSSVVVLQTSDMSNGSVMVQSTDSTPRAVDPKTNKISLPRVNKITTEPNPNGNWGLPGIPLTTSMTFESNRPLISNHTIKPHQRVSTQQQQSRKRRVSTLNNGGDIINGVPHAESMEMLYLNEVKKKNLLLEEQRDISRKRLELEQRKVSMMEQFFPKCLEMQEQILSKLGSNL